MKLLVRIFVIAAALVGLQSDRVDKRASNGQIHAVIVAGSNTWYNYRHQADACHAYHTLRRHGVMPENIIVMMYDDIANNPKNPYKGKIFNRPHGEDVYKGVKIDYSKESVTVYNFLNILKGNANAIIGGNGKVLRSTHNDRVFVFYSDHGGLGTFEFPDGLMTARLLNETLDWMHKNKKYGQLVFYLESCYSGSVFDGFLPNTTEVYAVTACARNEASYATYCDNDMGLPCLGDEFSVSWMEDSDANDVNNETLEQQFLTAKNRTYWSRVSNFGDLRIKKMPVGWFHGEERLSQSRDQCVENEPKKKGSWLAFDVELMYLRRLLESANDVVEAKEIKQSIRKIQDDRQQIESLFAKLVDSLIDDGAIRRRVMEEYDPVRDLNCHHEVMLAFSTSCINFSKFDYALKYTNVLNNLCTELADAGAIIATMQTVCSDTHARFL